MKTPGRSCGRWIVATLLAGLPALGAACAAAETDPAPPPSPDARIAAARQTLRAMECARCHGKDYEGLAAPSIVEYARTQSREMFVRAVLDGDPTRGMPGYRGNPRIAESIEDIYGYFLDRAMGANGRGP